MRSNDNGMVYLLQLNLVYVHHRIFPSKNINEQVLIEADTDLEALTVGDKQVFTAGDDLVRRWRSN